jgi:DNA-binding SARP family transcriptional activator/tetratricopeptide (TPR) repeat protein
MKGARFFVLGRVGVAIDGEDVPIPGRRERAVLASLLAARGQVVSVDRLILDIWGDAAADSAPASLQVAVSRLRAIVEPGRAPRTESRFLVSSGPGYALVADPETVDAERFAALVEDAHLALEEGEPERAWRLTEEAGALWSGVPFAEALDSELVNAEKARLEDLRLTSMELRAEALLALGRHAVVSGDLEGLVRAHPFRERFWGLHALALYRSGRQADALDTLRRAKHVLADELGVDPSPALRELEADLLSQDGGLDGVGRRIATATMPLPADEHDGAVIGRESALRELDAALTQVVANRRGRSVVVTGDPGIGKTRIVTEVARAATERGARVFWGRCHEADVSPAYWPWVPIVRELAGPHPSEVVRGLLSPESAQVSVDANSAALRTYDAVSRLIETAARDTPVVVVLEDVHWADAASLQLLAFAAEALIGVPVLLVTTTRVVAEPSAALQVVRAALARQSAARVSLTGLAHDEVRELVVQLTGAVVDEEFTAVLTERTDGNPFFVIELARLLESEGRFDAAGARAVEVPDGVGDVLRLRLARIDEDVRQLLSVASVAGREFDLALLTQVTDTPVERALDLLDSAVAAYTIEEAGTAGAYRFTHALVRETLYAGLTVARRGLLHARIAEALEPRLALDPELVVELAHHFVLGAALRPQLAEPAVQHSMTAARIAAARGALDQALVHWEEALTADGIGAEEPLRRHEVLLGLGRARYRRGDVAGSREALTAAVEIGRARGDAAMMAEAATSFRGAGVWHWREFGTSDPEMVAVLEECLAALPPGPLRVRVQVSLAMELTYQRRSLEADEVARGAVDAARGVADDELFADVVALHTLALWGKPGAAGRRLELAREALELPLSREQELYVRFGGAASNMQLGNTAEAVAQMNRCVELTRRLRHSGADVPVAWWLYYRALDAGDTEGACVLFEEALERHRLSSTVALGDLEPLGRLRLAGPGAAVPDEYVEYGRQSPNPAFRAFIAHALAESGRAAEGAALLGEPAPEGTWDYASFAADCLRVDALAAAGETDRLRTAFARIVDWGQEFAMYGSTDCIGSVHYFIGRGYEGLGDLDRARTEYELAAEANANAGIVPWERRARRRLEELGAR